MPGTPWLFRIFSQRINKVIFVVIYKLKRLAIDLMDRIHAMTSLVTAADSFGKILPKLLSKLFEAVRWYIDP